jgi:survival-of-motor-neuron-related-splicing factor 30
VLKGEVEAMISALDDSIAEAAASRKVPTPPAPENQEKWSKADHPAFRKAPAPPLPTEDKEPESSTPIIYHVNDDVMAKWVTGDKGFYPARITSVTGSSTAPVYTVKFKSYNDVETLRGKDIRPMTQKRKADGTVVGGATGAMTPNAGPAVSSTLGSEAAESAKSNNGIVMSAAADMYPNAQQNNTAGADGNGEENPKKKFKKIKATKELEAGKSKWQEFSTKGKHGKSTKKDSMFRTPEGVNARGTKRPFHPSPEGDGSMLTTYHHSGVYWIGTSYAQRPSEKPPYLPAKRRSRLTFFSFFFFFVFPSSYFRASPALGSRHDRD